MTVFIASRKAAEGSQSIFGFLEKIGYGWRASNISKKKLKNIKLPKTNLCEPSAPLREVFMTSACITLRYCLMTVFITSRKGAEGSQSIFGFLEKVGYDTIEE